MQTECSPHLARRPVRGLFESVKVEKRNRKLPVTRTTQFDRDLRQAQLELGANSEAETVRQVLYQWVRRKAVCEHAGRFESEKIYAPKPIGDG